MSAQRERVGRRPELSQHFLRSGALAGSLVAGTHVSKRDLVVEIGAGNGVLTAALARRCHRVLAVEVDPRLCGLLRERFREHPYVSIIEADFLRWALPSGPHMVVGNIPFNQTAAIIGHLVGGPALPEDAYLVTQREAAHRFAGAPHAPESLSSLLLKPGWQVEIVRRLRRTDFEPPPSVDAVVLWLARRPRPLVHQNQRALYARFIRSSFGRRGNTIGQCLRSTFTSKEIRRLSTDLRFRLDAPPSGVTFDQWLGLFRFHALRRRDSSPAGNNRHDVP